MLYTTSTKENNKTINEVTSMEKEKYSVVVLMASYNGEKYIVEQIESLIHQEEVDVKIIVSDDGSSDNTISILKEYQRRGILEWYNGPHKGVEKNFLKLMKNAPEADFYAFCDQDDFWEKRKLIEAILKLKNFDSNKPALYFSSLKLVDQDLNLISVHRVNLERSEYARFIFAGVAGCTMVFNRALLNLCNQIEPMYIRMHDVWVYNVCVAMGGSYYADYESYIKYRQHSNNVVGIKKKSIKESFNNYVLKSKVSKHMESLVAGYGKLMTNEYRMLCKDLIKCNYSITSRMKLLFSWKIKFGNNGLDIIFKLKVLLCKM